MNLDQKEYLILSNCDGSFKKEFFPDQKDNTASLAQLVKHVGTEGISDSQNSVQVLIPCSPSYSSKKNLYAIQYNE